VRSEAGAFYCSGRTPQSGPLEGEPASHKLVKIGHVRLGRLLDHAYDLP
jgi:hypothetical protein